MSQEVGRAPLNPTAVLVAASPFIVDVAILIIRGTENPAVQRSPAASYVLSFGGRHRRGRRRPAESQNDSGLAQGLSDPLRQVERAVDRRRQGGRKSRCPK